MAEFGGSWRRLHWNESCAGPMTHLLLAFSPSPPVTSHDVPADSRRHCDTFAIRFWRVIAARLCCANNVFPPIHKIRFEWQSPV